MSVEITICPQCGAPMPVNARFCSSCGHANEMARVGDGGSQTVGSSVNPSGSDTPTVNTRTAGFGNAPLVIPSPPPTAPLPTWQPGQYGANQGNGGQGYPPTQNLQAPPPYSYSPYSQYGVQANVPVRDSTLALLLELIGYVGFLGIGHMYAGRIGWGIGLMIGWWIYLAAAFVFSFVGIGCCMDVLALAVPVLSGLYIKWQLDAEQAAIRGF